MDCDVGGARCERGNRGGGHGKFNTWRSSAHARLVKMLNSRNSGLSAMLSLELNVSGHWRGDRVGWGRGVWRRPS